MTMGRTGNLAGGAGCGCSLDCQLSVLHILPNTLLSQPRARYGATQGQISFLAKLRPSQTKIQQAEIAMDSMPTTSKYRKYANANANVNACMPRQSQKLSSCGGKRQRHEKHVYTGSAQQKTTTQNQFQSVKTTYKYCKLVFNRPGVAGVILLTGTHITQL